VAGNPTAFATSTYRYDGLGRRIQKTLSTQSSALSTSYVYDGEDILLEYDGGNVLQARYTHGPGIDEPIAVTKGGSTFFYHQDGLGTVTDLTDSVGATAKSYSYDAYGAIVDQTGTVEQSYTYTGRELDSETGLMYYRARYYDPTTGRFLHKDPIGFAGGDLNLYSYVKNNPTNFIDPAGAATITIPFPNDPSIPGIRGLGGVLGGLGLILNILSIRGDTPSCPDNEECEKAKQDARRIYNRLVNKRFPQYDPDTDPGQHDKAIQNDQAALRKAIGKVRLYCKPLPGELPDWERVANMPVTPRR